MSPATATLTHPTPTTTPPSPENAAHTWTVTTTEGLTLTGYQPDWSMDNPTRTNIPLDQAVTYLRDYAHYTVLPTAFLLPPTDADTDTDGTSSSNWTFLTQIECHPYSDQLHEHTPTALIVISEDHEISNLDPTDLARIATQLRTQADLFDHTVRPALIAARADWTTHHQTADDLS